MYNYRSQASPNDIHYSTAHFFGTFVKLFWQPIPCRKYLLLFVYRYFIFFVQLLIGTVPKIIIIKSLVRDIL